MSLFVGAIIVVTAILALYWVFYGQRRYDEMFNPPKKSELKAFIFDLDGVILDSFDSWHKVVNQIRKELGMKSISVETFRKDMWGGPVDRELKYFKGLTKDQLIEKYKKAVLGHVDKTVLLPDARDVLRKIKKRLKIGLVTNSFKNTTKNFLKHHKIHSLFDAVVAWEDAEKPKPHPSSILKAAKLLGVSREEIIYVGDTRNDYKAARAAGCFFVGLNTKGDLVIGELKDLLKLV